MSTHHSKVIGTPCCSSDYNWKSHPQKGWLFLNQPIGSMKISHHLTECAFIANCPPRTHQCSLQWVACESREGGLQNTTESSARWNSFFGTQGHGDVLIMPWLLGWRWTTLFRILHTFCPQHLAGNTLLRQLNATSHQRETHLTQPTAREDRTTTQI